MMVVGCGKTEAEKRVEEDSKESVKELTKEDVFRSYEFGNEKAKDALKVLSEDQLVYIKNKLNQGGVET